MGNGLYKKDGLIWQPDIPDADLSVGYPGTRRYRGGGYQEAMGEGLELLFQ